MFNSESLENQQKENENSKYTESVDDAKIPKIDEDNKDRSIQLRTQIGTLTAVNAELNIGLESKKRIVEQLEIQLMQYKEKVKELEDQKDGLKAERDELENRLAFKDAVTPRSLHELMFRSSNLSFESQSEKSNLPLENENKRLAERVQELEALEPLKKELFLKAQIEVDDIRSEKNNLQKEVDRLKAFISDCSVKLQRNENDQQNEPQSIIPLASKQFILRHTFKNVSKIEQGKKYYSDVEEYFGIPWSIVFRREDNKLTLRQKCNGPSSTKVWSIQAEFELRVVHPNGKTYARNTSHCFTNKLSFGWPEFLKWDELIKDYAVNDEVRVEARVEIIKITGIYKDDSRSFFDDRECSDIVLIVNNQKFYVSKLYLAAHSSYFKTMFLGMFGDSTKSEIALTGIDADDFQKYLEVLYGEYVIDENTVEGILLIADMYDTQIVIRKCEEFLIKETKKSLKKKLQMSVRYSLETLKNKCLSEIKTMNDVRSVTPDDIQDMDPSLVAILFNKSLGFK